MGCDIHSFAEKKVNDKWERIEEKIFHEDFEPFGWRSYSMFGFLADVRNYSNVKPISKLKGLPEDSEYLNSSSEWGYKDIKADIYNNGNYHSFSYITLEELLSVDYNFTFNDVRGTSEETCIYDPLLIPIEGETTTLKKFLGTSFFEDLEILKTLEDPDKVRIIFYFDN